MSTEGAKGRLSLRQKIRGHYRTLQPFFARSLRPIERPPTESWSHEFDTEVGLVRLSGQLLRRSSEELLVVLHGLGGSTNSGYMALALNAAERAGKSCLLLNCRGADRSGADIYHSGLSEDVAQALSNEVVRGFSVVDLLGYSIGGHIALAYCCRDVDPRVRRVAAVGSPLDLRAAADDFDQASFNVYRGHVLDALKEIYTAAFQRHPDGLDPIAARKIKTIRAWDENIVAPRFGFTDADDYYDRESVGPRLENLQVDALYLGASCDPMVLARSVRPHLNARRLRVEWDERGGHLGFSSDFRMGMPGDAGVEAQVLSWLFS